MTFSGSDTSPTVDSCSLSICRTQSPEELERVGERSLGWTDCRAAILTFFLMLTRRRRGLGERGDKSLRWRHSNCTHYDACRRETAWVFHSQVRAWARGRLSGRFQFQRIAPYRLDQSRVEAYTTGFSQTSIFIPSPLSGRTNGAQWRQGESKCLPCFS